MPCLTPPLGFPHHTHLLHRVIPHLSTYVSSFFCPIHVLGRNLWHVALFLWKLLFFFKATLVWSGRRHAITITLTITTTAATKSSNMYRWWTSPYEWHVYKGKVVYTKLHPFMCLKSKDYDAIVYTGNMCNLHSRPPKASFYCDEVFVAYMVTMSIIVFLDIGVCIL